MRCVDLLKSTGRSHRARGVRLGGRSLNARYVIVRTHLDSASLANARGDRDATKKSLKRTVREFARSPPKRIHGEDADTGNGSYKIKGDPSHV
jgi:hypothetical protein